MPTAKQIKITEAAQQCQINEDIIAKWIEDEWIYPFRFEESILDHEDLARIRLIKSLRSQLGVNDEAIPIILDLVDQLHSLCQRIKRERPT